MDISTIINKISFCVIYLDHEITNVLHVSGTETPFAELHGDTMISD